jgi:hypothetical protein
MSTFKSTRDTRKKPAQLGKGVLWLAAFLGSGAIVLFVGSLWKGRNGPIIPPTMAMIQAPHGLASASSVARTSPAPALSGSVVSPDRSPGPAPDTSHRPKAPRIVLVGDKQPPQRPISRRLPPEGGAPERSSVSSETWERVNRDVSKHQEKKQTGCLKPELGGVCL